MASSGHSLSLLCLGALTILMAGISALWETDIKKIVALSTLSQLGIIIGTLGAGLSAVAYFHLVRHAFFKALLFMGVGSVIHRVRDYQDLRKVGLMVSASPTTLAYLLTANFRLCGLPFTSGFFSKDLCLEISARIAFSGPALFIFYFATALTAAYTARFIFIVFFTPEKGVSLG